jgi:hypothetical protein
LEHLAHSDKVIIKAVAVRQNASATLLELDHLRIAHVVDDRGHCWGGS